ncbi:unnamed protein product, partial [Colias eurytheme]
MHATPARSARLSRPRFIVRRDRYGAVRSSSAPGRPSHPFWQPAPLWETPRPAAAAEEESGANQTTSPRTAYLSDVAMIDRFVQSGLLSYKLRGWLASYIEMRRGDLARMPPGCWEEPSPEDEQVLLDRLASVPIPPSKPRARRRRLISSSDEDEEP